ncbi:Hypothetical protein PHPALM_6063 [Phytophthora palmivora]|uniref:SWIM-type domain-containing protein n=1 Tax=Phytophthora palmivora TaxID=4796 RepID=A0A2P4YG38_9STRA|nr:Hypothetical protein PHPALM_6063 [Phytophthora palmivora]
MFERWGETLTMDFTHGTNNLGYHLVYIATRVSNSICCFCIGSLVVTTATGRGFPVVDSICLNVYAVTIKTILDYFKEKNPMWSNVSNQTFTCHDMDWTCTCLFFRSNHLPCCHLMHVASRGHEFKMLPVMSIPSRWSTFAALSVKEGIISASNALQRIVNMTELKLQKGRLRLPDGTYDEAHKFNYDAAVNQLPNTEKQVVFVRLRRYKKANQVVLSSAEKYSYAKAMLEPLLQHLSELSNADFYQELSAWKEAVKIGIRRKNKDSSSKDEGNINAAESGMYSMLDPADAMGTVSIMESLETSGSENCVDGCSDDDEIPPTQPATAEVPPLSHRLTSNDKLEGNPEKASAAFPFATEAGDYLKSNDENPSNDSKVSADSSMPMRQVDIISVSKPKGRGRSRSTSKQLRQTKLITRLAVHKYPCELTVPLDQFVIWARNTDNIKYVAEMVDKYPVQLEDAYLRSRTIQVGWEVLRPTMYMHTFVTPIDLMRSMEAAIKTARIEQKEPYPLEARIKQQGVVLDLVASIDPKL